MKVYETEEDQIKAIKKFWNNNKKIIFVAILIILLLSISHNIYNNNKYYNANKSVNLYYGILQANIDNKNDIVNSEFNELKTNYPKSAYSSLAALVVASREISDNKYQDAITNLEWVRQQKVDGISIIATLRLARIYTEINMLDEAKKTINSISSKDFLAEKNLILGNIAVAEKDLIKAKQFYKTALDNSDKKSQYELWELASMKYANVNFAS